MASLYSNTLYATQNLISLAWQTAGTADQTDQQCVYQEPPVAHIMCTVDMLSSGPGKRRGREHLFLNQLPKYVWAVDTNL